MDLWATFQGYGAKYVTELHNLYSLPNAVKVTKQNNG